MEIPLWCYVPIFSFVERPNFLTTVRKLENGSTLVVKIAGLNELIFVKRIRFI
jgi:hypothetical protein